eukprot:TRINITY_DN26211_c0_g1_i1.p1 TRINITY_DN26211_c0_g1~~TRINITY_DN26211_c0_g1_i1.p1  ORF type:complete len:777 (-),score=96.90 TRINITY_DN26211_c0_g1_i1:830-3010(-)
MTIRVCHGGDVKAVVLQQALDLETSKLIIAGYDEDLHEELVHLLSTRLESCSLYGIQGGRVLFNKPGKGGRQGYFFPHSTSSTRSAASTRSTSLLAATQNAVDFSPRDGTALPSSRSSLYRDKSLDAWSVVPESPPPPKPRIGKETGEPPKSDDDAEAAAGVSFLPTEPRFVSDPLLVPTPLLAPGSLPVSDPLLVPDSHIISDACLASNPPANLPPTPLASDSGLTSYHPRDSSSFLTSDPLRVLNPQPSSPSDIPPPLSPSTASLPRVPLSPPLSPVSPESPTFLQHSASISIPADGMGGSRVDAAFSQFPRSVSANNVVENADSPRGPLIPRGPNSPTARIAHSASGALAPSYDQSSNAKFLPSASGALPPSLEQPKSSIRKFFNRAPVLERTRSASMGSALDLQQFGAALDSVKPKPAAPSDYSMFRNNSMSGPIQRPMAPRGAKGRKGGIAIDRRQVRRSFSLVSEGFAARELFRSLSEKQAPSHAAQLRLDLPRRLNKLWRDFTLKEIEDATQNFSESRLLGKGGFSKVYRGVLPDGEEVAVKRMARVDSLEVGDESSAKESSRLLCFLETEVTMMSAVRHASVLALKGYCLDEGENMLVYELMERGTLADCLYGDVAIPLSWDDRYHVAIDVARGLEYLHSYCLRPIIHRDVKASNILLTNNLNAKVSRAWSTCTATACGPSSTATSRPATSCSLTTSMQRLQILGWPNSRGQAIRSWR